MQLFHDGQRIFELVIGTIVIGDRKRAVLSVLPFGDSCCTCGGALSERKETKTQKYCSK